MLQALCDKAPKGWWLCVNVDEASMEQVPESIFASFFGASPSEVSAVTDEMDWEERSAAMHEQQLWCMGAKHMQVRGVRLRWVAVGPVRPTHLPEDQWTPGRKPCAPPRVPGARHTWLNELRLAASECCTQRCATHEPNAKPPPGPSR